MNLFFFSLKCSVSCGTGLQVRKIECVDAFGGMNTNCDVKTKPVATQQCSTGILCTSVKTEDEHEHVDSEVHRYLHICRSFYLLY